MSLSLSCTLSLFLFPAFSSMSQFIGIRSKDVSARSSAYSSEFSQNFTEFERKGQAVFSAADSGYAEIEQFTSKNAQTAKAQFRSFAESVQSHANTSVKTIQQGTAPKEKHILYFPLSAVFLLLLLLLLNIFLFFSQLPNNRKHSFSKHRNNILFWVKLKKRVARSSLLL